MNTKEVALLWLSQGVSTCPLYFKSKYPHSRALIRSGFVQGDGRSTWQPLKTRLPSEKQIDLWFGDGQPANLAVICGWQNLVVLDFDVPESFVMWYCWQLEHSREILNTFRCITSRGIHYYYFLKEPIKLNNVQNALFEIKSNGKMTTTPPSVHESGRAYTPLDNPANIKAVTPEQILNYSPVVFEPLVFPLRQRSKYAPAEVFTDNPIEAIKAGVPILSFFPNAQKIDERFYRYDCPFHGHKSNFWIDTQLNICGCFASCVPVMNVVQFYARLNEFDIKQSIKELSYLL